MNAHVSVVAGVALEEWESMLSGPGLGIRLNLATKSLLRQFIHVHLPRSDGHEH